VPGEAPDEQPTVGRDEQDASDAPARRVRVDARLLEANLLNLRKRIAAIPLVFDIPGADEASAERAQMLSQIDDYLLPRVRQSAAPILVALVGSTGAGKSTLVNSIVGTQVSNTGVRRPTTNSPVLACHPDDMHWFAENMFLPTLPRVRQEGLARAGRDGMLVLAANERMPKGFALLDTPDIDSVAHSHREFAYQFLDAADLWLFMTSSSRYADAPVWEVLQHARERGAALGIVLSRVPHGHREELVSHFDAMLDANGITADRRFVIPDTAIVDNMLPQEVYQPIKDWLAETAVREDRRVAVLSQTMSGVLDTFKIRVPRLAAHVDAQVTLRVRLRRLAEGEYAGALSAFDVRTKAAGLLRGEVLARWQDCADSGDLGAALRSRRPPRKGKRARKGVGNSRVAALDAALRAAIEALVASLADRAAEQVSAAWRADTAGAALLAEVEASQARGEEAEREFNSVFGAESAEWAASLAAEQERDAGGDSAGDEGPGAAATTASEAAAQRPVNGLGRSSPELPARAGRAVGTWQEHVTRLVQAQNASNRAGARGPGRLDPDSEPLSLLAMIAVLGDSGISATDAAMNSAANSIASGEAADIVEVPREVLTRAFGASQVDVLLAKARADLGERVKLLFDEELLRFVAVLDRAGPLDPVAAVRLYQAEYSLEAAR
jgi:energy-coupling factor transporter ATP-binding protein EcfA2